MQVAIPSCGSIEVGLHVSPLRLAALTVQAQAAAAAAFSPAQANALTVFRRPMLGASPRLSSAFELPAVVGALGYSLSPVQVGFVIYYL